MTYPFTRPPEWAQLVSRTRLYRRHPQLKLDRSEGAWDGGRPGNSKVGGYGGQDWVVFACLLDDFEHFVSLRVGRAGSSHGRLTLKGYAVYYV